MGITIAQIQDAKLRELAAKVDGRRDKRKQST